MWKVRLCDDDLHLARNAYTVDEVEWILSVVEVAAEKMQMCEFESFERGWARER